MKRQETSKNVTAGATLSSALRFYRTMFYGHKRELLSHIAAMIPKEVETVADVFSGTGIVSWFLKGRGYRVIANDIMRYPFIRLRALVVNTQTVLDDRDLDLLCAPNGNRRDFIGRYYGETFGSKNSHFLDNWASNIPALMDPLKRDLAVFVPVICVSKYLKYASVTWNSYGQPCGFPEQLPIRWADIEHDIRSFNEAVLPRLLCTSTRTHVAHNGDAVALIPTINPDLLYLDPPYTCRAGKYERLYAFFDDLATIISGSGELVVDPYDTKCELAPYTRFDSRKLALVGFDDLFAASGHIPYVICSYNTTCDISPDEIAAIARVYRSNVTLKYIERPRPTNVTSGSRMTKEVLILCR